MEFLSQQGIPFEEKNVRADPDAIRELQELGSQSTPTIVVGDQVHVGFRPDELLALISAAGGEK
jgi:glutaredoxin-like protein NrdH